MKQSLKIEIGEGDMGRAGEMSVSVRCPDWEMASQMGVDFREEPPDGYKLVSYDIRSRGKSGRSVNLTMRFEYCDRRTMPFTLAEAYEFFRDVTTESLRQMTEARSQQEPA